MYYLNAEPTENGNYGNPSSNPFAGSLALDDSFLTAYLDARGFCTLTLAEDGTTITAVETNQAALAAYLAQHPDTGGEVEEPVSEMQAMEREVTDLMLADIEQGQFATALQLQLMEVSKGA